MKDSRSLRVMTYNLHSCLGRKGYHSLGDVVEVIKEYQPDIIASQELDVHVRRSGVQDQPKVIAKQLDFFYQYYPAREILQGSFGNAVFSRFPMRTVQARSLSVIGSQSMASFRRIIRRPQESRSALWVWIDHPMGGIHIMNTHLSLLKDVREYQVRELLGEEWLNAIKKDERVILMGDLNLGSNSRAYQWLLSALSDAQVDSGLKKPQKTFPSSSPLRNIDHIFYRGQMCPVHSFVPRVHLTRKASDHLPLIVDFEI